MAEPNSRARVFISSGQDKGSDEVGVVQDIAEQLESLGFDPYIAVREQSLRGIRENIFSQLENSEYFVFVDFKREALVDTPHHRGSLFCQQELAIASYLGLPLIALREEGVKPEDGLLGFLQANCIPFRDRHLIPAVVANEVQKRNWSANWRNELVASRDAREFHDADVLFEGRLTTGRFFHIDVHNRHPVKTARNCYAYINKIVNTDTGETLHHRPIELKWAGSLLPNAALGPKTDRMFDACWVKHAKPTEAHFQAYCDSTHYLRSIPDPGKYELEYVVMSETFSESTIKCTLQLGKCLGDTSFE